MPAESLHPAAERSFANVVRGFGALGFSEGDLLAHVMACMRPAAPGTEPEATDFFIAWITAYRERLPPLSAIEAGAKLPYGLYDVIDFLASSCDTVAEGFDKITRYFELVRRKVEYRIAHTPDRATVTMIDHLHADDWFFDEWTAGVVLGRFREVVGAHFRYEAVKLRRPRPDREAVDRAAAILGCEIEFGAPSACLDLAIEVWEAPLPSKNSRLRETLERHAVELLAELGRQADDDKDASRRVREALAAELRGGEPTIERVAKRLATAPRTLQRRLRDEGTSFQAVLDTVRADLARRYLADGKLGVSEVAFLLGYADASAFARAFKRWYKKGPAESRRAVSG